MKNYLKCIDCGIKISYGVSRCRSCAHKGVLNPNFGKGYKQKGNKNHNWKGGLSLCLDCGKQLSRYDCKHCQKCAYLGKRNHEWKGGLKKLWRAIRDLSEAEIWRIACFKRDKYTCQECEQYGGQLEVHHIKSFKKLFNEFLEEYNQFSIIEDRETLIRLALKYKPFWDVDNGKTLCKKCHRPNNIQEYI